MAYTPIVVAADHLTGVVADLFQRAGMPAADAAFMGRCLVDADLRGVHSHGTRYVVTYVKALRSGGYNPTPNIAVVKEKGGLVLLDGDRGAGHVIGHQAMTLAIARAREFGIGSVSVRNSTHSGAKAFYTQMAADAGCVGFASTNAGIAMAPWGGVDKLVALNPLSWAAPTNKGFAVDLDMATSVVAGSKLGLAKERGEKIPFGWALDEAGNPTDDPDQASILLPVGGAKGYGMAVCLDIITGVLSGGRFGAGLGSPGTAQIYQAIDIATFMPVDEFKAHMGELIDQLKSSRLAAGSTGIFLPGEIEYTTKQERLMSGIPMTPVVVDDINAMAAELGSDLRVTAR
ncbi:MAG: Ldh family oxidoreductase [Chloroflexi bacterium]|nr:Ldh family oxidoreductase [Chloroflexota bacterium]